MTTSPSPTVSHPEPGQCRIASVESVPSDDGLSIRVVAEFRKDDSCVTVGLARLVMALRDAVSRP